MKLRCAAIALLVLLLGGEASAQVGTQTVLVLRGPAALAAEDERLVEALRIYTRDRDCRLVVEGEAPATLEGRAAADVRARARAAAAALVVWVGRRGDGRAVYYVLGAASGDLRETEIAPLGAERTAVDVALKVRALLSRRVAREAEAERPPADADASVAPAAPPSPAPSPAPVPRADAPTATALVARPTPPPREEAPLPAERVTLGVAYGVFLPTDPSWTRQGLVLSAEVRVARIAGAPVSLAADAGLVSQPTQLVRGFDVTLADTPLGLGALIRGHWGRVGAGCGPRVGLHILDVSAAADDRRSGASRRYAAGLGGRAEADLRLFAYMKVFLGATFEGLVPKQDFTIAGAPALTTGGLIVVGTAGVAVLIL